MEEFFEVWTEWKNTKYHTRKHRGLSDAGEKWVTPIEMFENGPAMKKAAPPPRVRGDAADEGGDRSRHKTKASTSSAHSTRTRSSPTTSIRKSTSSGTSTMSPSSMCTTWRARRSVRRCPPSCCLRPALFSGGTGEASARSETKRARGQGVSGGASPALTSCGSRTVQGPRMQWA